MLAEFFDSFSVVDGIAVAILVYGIIVGLRRGLSGELSRMATAAAAILAAWYFSSNAAAWLMEHKEMTVQDAYNASFVAILFGTYALGACLRVLLRHMMSFTFKGKLERIGGALCGGLRAAAVAALLVIASGLLPESSFKADILQHSHIGRWLGIYLEPVYTRLSERFPAIRSRAAELEQAPAAGAGEGEVPTPAPGP